MSWRTVALGIGIVVALVVIVVIYQQVTQPTVLEIRPREVTADEVQYAVSELPAAFREGLSGSEAEVAKQLGLRDWAFDFTGGPFGCWIDIEETGQQTAGPLPSRKHPEMTINCDGKEGVLLFWFQPRITPQIPQPLKERFLGNKTGPPDLCLALDTNGKKTLRMANYGKPATPIVPLWFGWKDAEVKEQLDPVILKAAQTATILVIEATEKDVSNPRRVKLFITAVK
jgi:hypothetical protein